MKATLAKVATRQDEIYIIATSIEHSNQVFKAEAAGNFTRIKEDIR